MFSTPLEILRAREVSMGSEEREARYREALRRIKRMTDAGDPESYRCDDREGCLDTVHTVACEALGEPSETGEGSR